MSQNFGQNILDKYARQVLFLTFLEYICRKYLYPKKLL